MSDATQHYRIFSSLYLPTVPTKTYLLPISHCVGALRRWQSRRPLSSRCLTPRGRGYHTSRLVNFEVVFYFIGRGGISQEHTGSSISNDLFYSFIAPIWGMSLMSACVSLKSIFDILFELKTSSVAQLLPEICPKNV